MSLYAYLSDLRKRGIALTVQDGELKAEAPPGVLSDELRVTLRDRRCELIEALDRRRVVRGRIASALEAAHADPTVDYSLESEAITAAESHLEDEVVRFIDGEVDIEAVSEAWKSLIRLRKAGNARTRAAV